MRAPPHKQSAAQPGWGDGASKKDNTEFGRRALPRTTTPAKQPSSLTVATIQKSHSCQLRVSITSWRGNRYIELRECIATVPGMFWPTATKVVIDVSRLPDIIGALKAAETEARQLGLLPKGGAQ